MAAPYSQASALGCKVRRAPACPRTARAEHAAGIALALMGAAPLPQGALGDASTWESSGAPATIGAEAIVTLLRSRPAPAEIELTDIVTHGRAAAVSGRYLPQGAAQARLFCHMIRFTSASAVHVAHVVSFDHRDPAP